MATAKTSLLDELSHAPADEVTRMVYADALDVAGQIARAAYVRSAEGGRDLLATSELAWRQVVSPAKVRYCTHEGCSRAWSALELTADPALRTCGACKHEVAYCGSLDAVDAATRRRRLLVLDAALRPADADARYQYARRQLGLETTRVSELPLFTTAHIPTNIGELEIALGIRVPDDHSKPPRIHRVIPHPSDLVQYLNLHVHQPGPEGGRPYVLHCYRVVFAGDREAAEVHLRERFGAPLRPDNAVDVRTYGAFTVREQIENDGWVLTWISTTGQPAPSRVSELPLIVGPDVPARVGELETSLHCRLSEPMAESLRMRRIVVNSPQMSSLAITARKGQTCSPRDLVLEGYTITFASDREAAEARLRERFGEPITAHRGTAQLHMYGPYFVGEQPHGAWTLDWYVQRPAWSYAIGSSDRSSFVAALADAIGRARSLDDIRRVNPPATVGAAIGWTDEGNLIVVFRPGLAAIELARAFGWTELVAGPREPGGHMLHTVTNASVVLPRHGRFEVVPRLDGDPHGESFRGLRELLRTTPDDLVRIVTIRYIGGKS